MEHQRGATLIEVLITLLILKVGLLGVLAGQLLALKVVTDASQRTTVVALSHEITEKLAAFSTLAGSTFSSNHSLNMPSCNDAAPCSYQDSRQYLVARWQQKWQSEQSGYGLLFSPEFCLQQQGGQIELTASWRQHAAMAVSQGQACAATAGRSALQLR
ncbi:hypothetical protein GCM10010919_27330 [Alishewanella longhuensis]|uniref:Type IV pilus modification protein PilV n=1 Tax=Alishewanella longhuensis TaxID=1091037 RepID=A0ABQ3L085_9ALTE|nr:type IV pilus modification protein PilV [Alishewanella longhuensis]GHG74003.1 hypothetical protein GCM10010919_27330 [Alishewanella longhuensis]